MTIRTLYQSAEDPQLFYRYTVDQYHAAVRTGVIEEGAPFELLDGHIVRKLRNAQGEDPLTINPGHVWCVEALEELNSKLKRHGCHLRAQKPIALPPDNQPEPDAAIVRGTRDQYHGRHPAAEGVLCVIEVSDASLHRDRTIKQAICAGAAIPAYVIFNLPDRSAEVYADPLPDKGRYAKSVTLQEKATLTFPTGSGKGLSVTVRSILP